MWIAVTYCFSFFIRNYSIPIHQANYVCLYPFSTPNMHIMLIIMHVRCACQTYCKIQCSVIKFNSNMALCKCWNTRLCIILFQEIGELEAVILNDYLPSSCLHYMEQHSVKLCQITRIGRGFFIPFFPENQNRLQIFYSIFPLKKVRIGWFFQSCKDHLPRKSQWKDIYTCLQA